MSMNKYDVRSERWAVIEYMDGTRELVTSCGGHSESKDGNVVWIRSDGSVYYNGPKLLEDAFNVVKEGVVSR